MSHASPRPSALLAPLALASLVLAAPGCKSPCDDFNAFGRYEQFDEKDAAYRKEIKADEAGKFRVVCFRVGDKAVIDRAIQKATSTAGGSVQELSEREVVAALIEFARSAGGPYASRPVQLQKYDVTVKAEGLDPLLPISVRWKGDVKPVDLTVNEPDSMVTFLELGAGEFKLIFDPSKAKGVPLYCRGPELEPRGAAFGFRAIPFELLANGQATRLEVVTEDAQPVAPEVSIYEVGNFSGNLNLFLCQVLGQRWRDEQSSKVASFDMVQTYVWLNGTAGSGGGGYTIRAEWTQLQADGEPSDVVAKIGGQEFTDTKGQVQEDGKGGSYLLGATFDLSTRALTLRFELTPSEDPKAEQVEFSWTVNGKKYTEVVQARSR